MSQAPEPEVLSEAIRLADLGCRLVGIDINIDHARHTTDLKRLVLNKCPAGLGRSATILSRDSSEKPRDRAAGSS